MLMLDEPSVTRRKVLKFIRSNIFPKWQIFFPLSEKEVASCPASQIFHYNLTTCQYTCRSFTDGNKHCSHDSIPVDGCGCPDNTYLNEKSVCVPISKCSCYYKGEYLDAGTVILRNEDRWYVVIEFGLQRWKPHFSLSLLLKYTHIPNLLAHNTHFPRKTAAGN